MLADKFYDGSELVEEWSWRGLDPDAAMQQLSDPQAREDAIRDVAAMVLTAGESDETLWRDVHGVAAVATAASGLLDELLQHLAVTTPDRRQKIVEFAKDQAALSRREGADTMRHEHPGYGGVNATTKGDGHDGSH